MTFFKATFTCFNTERKIEQYIIASDIYEAGRKADLICIEEVWMLDSLVNAEDNQ